MALIHSVRQSRNAPPELPAVPFSSPTKPCAGFFRRSHTGSHNGLNDAVTSTPASGHVAAAPRDRAFQSLDTLCQAVDSRLGANPVVFPLGGASGMVVRMGSNEIVCTGPDDFYVEIVNGRITDKQGKSDAQISTFLSAAKLALG